MKISTILVPLFVVPAVLAGWFSPSSSKPPAKLAQEGPDFRNGILVVFEDDNSATKILHNLESYITGTLEGTIVQKYDSVFKGVAVSFDKDKYVKLYKAIANKLGVSELSLADVSFLNQQLTDLLETAAGIPLTVSENSDVSIQKDQA